MKFISCLCLITSLSACAPANVRKNTSVPPASGVMTHRGSIDLAKIPLQVRMPSLDIPLLTRQETWKESVPQAFIGRDSVDAQIRIAATSFADIKMKFDLDTDTIKPRSLSDIPQVIMDSNILVVFLIKTKLGI